MSSAQNKNQAKPSSAPEKIVSGKATTPGDSCSKEPSQAPAASSFPGSSLAKGIYSYTLGRSKTSENDDVAHPPAQENAPAREKSESAPAAKEKGAEKASAEEEEPMEFKTTDFGAGSYCVKPDSAKN
ncbi:hypothetical protein L873DRAFT_1820675 [Choiromyces venosus 120613-1]|uniref:Uncharacterized protein n=1 Tax=Choiromyces venosus 120613-1 TaxID=1336337 RepID=A0A3N4JA37_9PEZI|nr:hypothetical protein L873DRAFT_1820675 [Choiromyces venosus 120613-1]